MHSTTKEKVRARKAELIAKILRMQDRFFLNVIKDFGDHFDQRPNDVTNHGVWLAGHIVSCRLLIGNLIGLELPNPYPGLFEYGKGIDPEIEYPTLEDFRKNWQEISGQVSEAVFEMEDKHFEKRSPLPCPLGDRMGDLLAFLVQHESYHIGQLGLLRKYFGKEAMRYN